MTLFDHAKEIKSYTTIIINGCLCFNIWILERPLKTTCMKGCTSNNFYTYGKQMNE